MIIGLTGKKGCGKSTVGRIIAEEHNYGIKSFATPIKNMLSAMGLTNDQLYDPKLKEVVIEEWGKSPRELCQLLGTEFGRQLVSPSIWVTALAKQLDPDRDYVIDDVRFPNEAAMIKSKGGKIVRVVRETDNSDDEHISEAGLDSEYIDYEIRNISCYEMDLRNITNKVLEGILFYGTVQHSEFKGYAG